MAKELSILLLAKNMASKTINQVSRDVSKLGKTSRIVGKGMGNAARNIERGIALGATAAAGAMVWAVKAAIDWESAMAGVNKTIEATPVELKAIEAGLIAISNKTGAAATDLAAIAENAGALGIAKGDILAFTETVAMIGATTNVTTEEASTALGQLGNVLALTGADYDNFAATLVDLGNKGASTEAQILEIARRAGSAAKLFGIAKDETLGWAAAAANLGMNEELAGTSLQNLFLKTLNNFTRGENKMADFMGMTDKAMKSAFGKDASGLLASFIKKLASLPKDARLEETQSFFGKQSGINRLVLGLADSYDRNLSPALETSADAWEKNTAAAEEFAKRQATTQSQLNRLSANVKNAAVTIGTNLLPMVNELASATTDWISSHQGEIKQFGTDLAAGIKEAVKWAKSLNWDAIMLSLQAGATFAKGLITAFLMAPPWLQTFLAGGFVANKFTGGMVTSLAVELGKTMLGRGQTPVLPMYVKEVGLGGGGTGGPGGILGGGKGLTFTSLMKNIGALTIAFGSVALLADQWGKFRESGAAGAETLRQQTAAGVPQLNLAEAEAALRNTQEQLGNPINDLALKLSGTFDQVKATEKALMDRIAYLKGGGSVKPVVLGPPAPSYVGVIERAVAKGFAPTKTGIQATLDKNARAAVSGDDRMTARIGSLNAAVNSGTQASRETATAVRNIDFRPVVNVPVTVVSTVSVRGMTVAQSVRARYTRTAGDPVKGGAAKPT